MAIDDNANYTLTGAQVKDLANQVNGKADSSGLATVATSGSYADLLNTPTIPTVNDATLTIQKNGTTVDTFTANASSNKTVNITVPTSFSGLSGTVAANQFANNTIDKARLNWSTFRANFTATTDGNGFLAVPNSTVKPTTGFILGARMYNKDGICTVYNGYSEGRYTLKCTDWNWVPYGSTSIRCEIIYCLINFA